MVGHSSPARVPACGRDRSERYGRVARDPLGAVDAAWGALPRHGDKSSRSLRGIAIGRHNWTFVGSDRGGKTMAVLRSFVASCELAKVDPFAWFQDVLIRIGECSMQQLDELLPHRWAAARH
jgi:hypothetical protein